MHTGRVCNRIAKVNSLWKAKEYTLAINNEPNHLHGGAKRSLDKVPLESQAVYNERGTGVILLHQSDGEEGYPGTVQFTVTYLVPKDKNN